MSGLRQCFLLLIFFLSSTFLSAQEKDLMSIPYQPTFSKGTVKAYLEDIEQKTGVPFTYSTSSMECERQVQLSERSYRMQDALNAILANQKVLFIVRNEKILIVPASEARKYIKTESYTINGYIKEEGSKEVLIGATIQIPAAHTGTVTNNYGYYSISLPEGNYIAICSYIGYRSDTIDLKLTADRRMDVQLGSLTRLEEVKITTEKSMLPGYAHLTYDDIQKKPMLLGESDVVRALLNQPGVQAGMEGSNSLYVRGGEPGQNLHLMDGVPLYYTNHFGFTSIFNGDAVKSVDFHKSAFPARYGGRLSSVIEVNTKDGDMQRWGGQFNMGLMTANLNLEGPIIKDKASIMVSGRRTWVDGFWRPFTSDFKLDFYDLNVKTNYIINKNNRVYLSFYTGRDQIALRTDAESSRNLSGNTIFSAKWNTILHPKLFINTLLTYSEYGYNSTGSTQIFYTMDKQEEYNFGVKSSIVERAGSLQAHWYPNRFHHVEAGGRFASSRFLPTVTESVSPLSPEAANFVADFASNELTLYIEDDIKLGDKWTIRPGIHWSNWYNKDFGYSSMQPRFYASFTPHRAHTLHASFTQMTQFLHNISGGFTTSIFTSTITNWNLESWVPSTERISPEEALMGTIGYTSRPLSTMEFGLDLYYKDIQGIPMRDFRKFVFDNSLSWEEKIIQGKGWSYGLETYVNKRFGPVRASVSYTLSWNWRKYAEMNEGKPFPYRYDRRHNIKISGIYQPNKEMDFTANWTYMSGEAITFPEYLYPDFDNSLTIDPNYYGVQLYNYSYSSVNNYRLPSIHRLDVGVNLHKQKGKHVKRTWSLGMYNAYGRTNIMYIELMEGPNGLGLRGTGFLKFIPYASFKLKF